MTSPKRGAKTVFYDKSWNGCKVYLRPQEKVRRIHIGSRGYLPYFDGQQVGMTLTIKPLKRVGVPKHVICSWRVICIEPSEEYDKEYGSGLFEKDMLPNKLYPEPIVTDLIEQPYKYRVSVTLKESEAGEESAYTLALLPIKDWGKFSVELVLAVFTVLFSSGLSALISYLVAKGVR